MRFSRALFNSARKFGSWSLVREMLLTSGSLLSIGIVSDVCGAVGLRKTGLDLNSSLANKSQVFH